MGKRLFYILVVAVAIGHTTAAQAQWRDYVRSMLGRPPATPVPPVINYEEGLQPFKEAVLANPSAVEPRITLANMYIKRGLFKKALKELEKARQNGADAAVLYQVTTLLTVTGQPDEAQLLLSDAKPAPGALQVRHLVEQGHTHEALLRWALAAQTWQTLRTQYPTLPDGYLGQTNLALYQNNITAAQEAFNSMPPQNTPPSAWLLSTQGRLVLAQSNWPYAQALLQQAVAADPTHFEAYIPLVQALLKQQKYLEAQKLSTQVIQNMPELYLGYVMMGITATASRYYAEADRYFSNLAGKYIALYPEGLLHHAMAKMHLGRDNTAAEMLLQQFLERRPNHVQARYLLGNLLIAGARYQAAEDFFTTMQRQNPRDARVQQALAYLNLHKQAPNPQAQAQLLNDLLREGSE